MLGPTRARGSALGSEPPVRRGAEAWGERDRGHAGPIPGPIAPLWGDPTRQVAVGEGARPGWRVLEALALAGALAWAAAGARSAYLDSLAGEGVWAGVRVGGADLSGRSGDDLVRAVAEAAEARLDRPLTLRARGIEVQTSARALGLSPDPQAALNLATTWGRSGDLWADLRARASAARGEVDLDVGSSFDDSVALGELLALAPLLDRPSLPTRLDFAARKVLPAERGTALLAYDSLSNVAIGLARRDPVIELAVHEKAAVDDPLAPLSDQLDISVVLGTFTTPYHNDAEHADRNHNLKLGAASVEGAILMPGETFSFNERVGDRSVERGYRWASGITAGELIDTVGGGICQISSTLFGAAFFSGLTIVEQRPHSRPSAYVDMGLDSTVVYPTVDLKLRNDFEFPVVLHMTVNHGRVSAEVLGPSRPYQVAFERHLDEVTQFRTIQRNDAALQAGLHVISQRGMRGFKIKRKRVLYRAGQPIREEETELEYPATTEIIRVGTNPAGEVVLETKAPRLRDPAAAMRVVQ